MVEYATIGLSGIDCKVPIPHNSVIEKLKPLIYHKDKTHKILIYPPRPHNPNLSISTSFKLWKSWEGIDESSISVDYLVESTLPKKSLFDEDEEFLLTTENIERVLEKPLEKINVYLYTPQRGSINNHSPGICFWITENLVYGFEDQSNPEKTKIPDTYLKAVNRFAPGYSGGLCNTTGEKTTLARILSESIPNFNFNPMYVDHVSKGAVIKLKRPESVNEILNKFLLEFIKTMIPFDAQVRAEKQVKEFEKKFLK